MPLVAFAVAALVLSVVVVVGVPDLGPVDDTNEAAQRSGLLISAAQAKYVPALALPGAPVRRRPVLVVFDREVPRAQAFSRLLSQLPDSAAVVLTVPRPSRRELAGIPILADSSELAKTVGVATPRDGGAPVGYAVIDEKARVRYATLDPLYLQHPDEVATMLGAVS